MPRKTKAQLEAELLAQQKSAENEAESPKPDETYPQKPAECPVQASTDGGPPSLLPSADTLPDSAPAESILLLGSSTEASKEADLEDRGAGAANQEDTSLTEEAALDETADNHSPLEIPPEDSGDANSEEILVPDETPVEHSPTEVPSIPSASAAENKFPIEAQPQGPAKADPESGQALGTPTENTTPHKEALLETGVLPAEKEGPGSEPQPTASTSAFPDGDEQVEEDAVPEEKEPSPEDLQQAEAERLRAQRRSEFFHTNFKELDRDLSQDQLQEWQAIYASYRSQSILTGEVTGVDSNTFMMTNPETGELEKREIRSLVIISYRVKVLIPETELWFPGEERPGHVVRSMVGAQIDYVIQEVDRSGECAIGSRSAALRKQRRRTKGFYEDQAGAHVTCRVLAVGAKACLVEWGGFDVNLAQRHLSYTAIADLRKEYHVGQELKAVFRGFYPETGRPLLSVKEVNPNPYDGAEVRHPPGSRRQAVISGKYAGGVFCTMKDGVTCLCLYSSNHFDTQFAVGDSVLIRINFYDDERKLIYARILAKW